MRGSGVGIMFLSKDTSLWTKQLRADRHPRVPYRLLEHSIQKSPPIKLARQPFSPFIKSTVVSGVSIVSTKTNLVYSHITFNIAL